MPIRQLHHLKNPFDPREGENHHHDPLRLIVPSQLQILCAP